MRRTRATPHFTRRSAALVAFAMLLRPDCPVRADTVYKSVDAQGHVVYSDRNSSPTAQKSIVQFNQPDPAEAARIAREQQILKAEELQRKQQQSANDKQKVQLDQMRQAQCDTARNRYYAVKDARRVFHLDADGNRVYLSDAEADAMREEARQAVTAACGT